MENKVKSINYIITRSFLVSIFIALLVVVSFSIWINSNEMKNIHQDNMIKVNQTLVNVIEPALEVGDSDEVIRLLTRTSDSREKIAVIDRGGDLLMANYADYNVFNTIYKKYMSTNSCDDTPVIEKLQGKPVLVSCMKINSNNIADNKTLGYLISLSKKRYLPSYALLLNFSFAAFLTIVLLVIWFRYNVQKKLLKPLTLLNKRIVGHANNNNENIDRESLENSPYEVKTIENEFNNLIKKLETEHAYRINMEKKKALFDLATKVAHDVRSPLALLAIVVDDDNTSISNNVKSIISNSVDEIRDITNDLLEKNRVVNAFKNDEKYPLPFLISRAIYECKLQIGGITNNIKFVKKYLSSSKYSLFVNANMTKFKSVLKNIITNSIESMDHGIIEVDLNDSHDLIEVVISDTGCGIEKRILSKIGTIEGVSNGKTSGNGLAIYNAKKYLASIGGTIQIESLVNCGTTVTIRVPKTCTPDWYISSPSIPKEKTVVILDDDRAVHSYWKKSFCSTNLCKDIHCYSKVDDFETQIESYKKNVFFLIDYDIKPSMTTGIDLIKKYNLYENAILVTNMYEDYRIIEQCIENKIKLIFKDNLPYFNSL